MSWIQDIFAPEDRTWESFYRNRWSYDKKVRSTHGVNCTGSCSWEIYVKNGVVVWELQALDYPIIDKTIPPYEPRGCQRGISYSWYIYSPIRVKYPYIRGALLDLWRKAKKAASRRSGRGVALHRQRSGVAQEIPAGARQGRIPPRLLGRGQRDHGRRQPPHHPAPRAGPHRRVSRRFRPCPCSATRPGARFCQLMGGVSLSFYDWYCDLPPASPEIWGEQTDVAESADWYHSKFIATVGSNVLMTRTPDAHFLVEARHGGAKVVVFSPDFSQTSKVADEWIPLHQGTRRRVLDGRRPRDPQGELRRPPGARVPGLHAAIHRRRVPRHARPAAQRQLPRRQAAARQPARRNEGPGERRLEILRRG